MKLKKKNHTYLQLGVAFIKTHAYSFFQPIDSLLLWYSIPMRKNVGLGQIPAFFLIGLVRLASRIMTLVTFNCLHFDLKKHISWTKFQHMVRQNIHHSKRKESENTCSPNKERAMKEREKRKAKILF